MDETTIHLEYPLKLNEIEYREITLKRPKLGHFAKCQNLSGFEQTIKLLSLISGIGSHHIEQMDLVDLKKCTDFLDVIESNKSDPDPA